MGRTALFTIGYEGRVLDELLAMLSDVVASVAEEARGRRAVLLCYEAEPSACHRSLLAPRVATLLGVAVRDL